MILTPSPERVGKRQRGVCLGQLVCLPFSVHVCPKYKTDQNRPTFAAIVPLRKATVVIVVMLPFQPVALAAYSSIVTLTCRTCLFSHPTRSSLHHFFSPEQSTDQFAAVPELLASLPLPPESVPPFLDLPSHKPHPNPYQRIRPTYALVVSYDGRAFPGGFEHNSSLDAPTVQGTLTERLWQVTGNDRIRISTAGRTDAKVSAKAALITFPTKDELDERALMDNLNGMSRKGDIAIRSASRVHSSFHATFGTTAREYLYVLPLMFQDQNSPSSSDEGGCASRIARIADALLGEVVGKEMDYVGMSKGKIKSQDSLRTLLNAGCWYYNSSGIPGGADGSGGRDDDVVLGFGDCWKDVCRRVSSDHGIRDDNNARGSCLVFRVKGDRFLRRMMRKVVNSVLLEASEVLIEVGDEDLPQEGTGWRVRWRDRVERKDRTGNGPAPPEGLCLWCVEVQPTIANK